MEFEDLFKVLLALLFILPGLFSGKKKKTEQKQTQFPQNTGNDDPFKDFREILQDFKVETEAEHDDFFDEAIDENTELESVKSIDTLPSEEGQSVFQQEDIDAVLARLANMEAQNNVISDEEIKNSEIGSNDDDILQDFDARKAVIYSEILTTKYN